MEVSEHLLRALEMALSHRNLRMGRYHRRCNVCVMVPIAERLEVLPDGVAYIKELDSTVEEVG